MWLDIVERLSERGVAVPKPTINTKWHTPSAHLNIKTGKTRISIGVENSVGMLIYSPGASFPVPTCLLHSFFPKGKGMYKWDGNLPGNSICLATDYYVAGQIQAAIAKHS